MIEPSRAGTGSDADCLEASAMFPNKAGLHARSAALLIKATSRYQATVTLDLDGRTARTSSLMELLKLGARKGHVVRVRASGQDAATALKEVTSMIESGFNEE